MAWLKLLAAALAFINPTSSTRPPTPVVASRAGSTWFALTHGHELTIYRLKDRRLRVDGDVRVPKDFPAYFPGGRLTATSLIPGQAPNFTLREWGADTLWFAIAARVRGRWQFVPFDDFAGRRHRWTLAYGAAHHLIHGIVDSCGCASGPTTEQWYRFAGDIFIATAPPGAQAQCSANALAAARHWPRLPYDPLVRAIDQPLAISRFACDAGWALATDGRTIGVYEQRARSWLRVGIGSRALVGSHVEFAMPQSLLVRLGRRIGVAFAT